MLKNFWRLIRILPLILGVVALFRRRKKTDEVDDTDRGSLEADIEELTTLAASGEADDRRDIAFETAERLRAALARQQVNKGAMKGYRKRREDLGLTITATAATDKRFDRKLRELRDAAGKLAGAG